MHLFELVQPVTNNEIGKMTEQEITERVVSLCKEMNWQYDIDPLNEHVFDIGHNMLKRIEDHLVVLFAKNKEAALNLWEMQCPFAIPGIMPSFTCRTV